MVAEARACATKMGSGPGISTCVEFATHLTPSRIGTAGESMQKSVQEDDISPYNSRERYMARGVGRNPERKYACNTALKQRGMRQKSSIPNIRRMG